MPSNVTTTRYASVVSPAPPLPAQLKVQRWSSNFSAAVAQVKMFKFRPTARSDLSAAVFDTSRQFPLLKLTTVKTACPRLTLPVSFSCHSWLSLVLGFEQSNAEMTVPAGCDPPSGTSKQMFALLLRNRN